MSIVRARKVNAGFGRTHVLHDLSVDLGKGVTGILGVNGAGKSTLLRTLTGVLAPVHGSVWVDGFDPYASQERKSALAAVGLVPQAFDFPPRYGLEEFLSYIAWMRGVSRQSRKEAVERAADQVDLSSRLHSRLRELSGGMLRRAAIAQALVADPAILVLDEPTAGLDPEQRSSVRSLVQSLANDRAVLLATHIVEDLGYTASRVLILDGGRFVFDGSVRDLEAIGPAGDSSLLESGFLAVVRRARAGV